MAAASPIAGPTALLLDGKGGLYFVEEQTLLPGGVVLRYITPDGHLKTIAGNWRADSRRRRARHAGGNGHAESHRAGSRPAGNLYVADGFNHRVRVIAPNGIINTFAGNGKSTTAGDGGLAQNAGFSIPRGLLFDAQGDLFISDVADNRIREVLAAPPASPWRRTR